MAEPKRHHWWPQLQSRHWINSDGLIYATRPDGSYFTASPEKTGAQNELYTRFGEAAEKNNDIERWFSRDIETPFAASLNEIVALDEIHKERFNPDPQKAAIAKELGCRVFPYREYVHIPENDRLLIANYTAALLVRNPQYISKLKAFHANQNKITAANELATAALENMLFLYDRYRAVIRNSPFMFVLADTENEFLFSDAGITAQEPWNANGIPFDIHFPLTPRLAVQILPVPNDTLLDRALVVRAAAGGIARSNKIALGSAKRFVFSRSRPPTEFIVKHFGVPAPAAYGHRIVNGKLETVYDRSRDR